jgi:hypothetical protein
MPYPVAFPRRVLPAPWLVAEAPASPDRHTNERHVHVDRLYVAIADRCYPAAEPEHHVRWFTLAGIAGAPAVSEDSRILAAQLLALLGRARNRQGRPVCASALRSGALR